MAPRALSRGAAEGEGGLDEKLINDRVKSNLILMETHKDEMVRRVALGLLLVIGGYVFFWPLQFLSFFSGLWLFGLALGPREMEDAPRMSKSSERPSVQASAPQAKPVQKKASRKRKSS